VVIDHGDVSIVTGTRGGQGERNEVGVMRGSGKKGTISLREEIKTAYWKKTESRSVHRGKVGVKGIGEHSPCYYRAISG